MASLLLARKLSAPGTGGGRRRSALRAGAGRRRRLGLAGIRLEPRLGAAARSCAACGIRCRRSGCSRTSACASGMRAATPAGHGLAHLRLRGNRRAESGLHRRRPRLAMAVPASRAGRRRRADRGAASRPIVAGDADVSRALERRTRTARPAADRGRWHRSPRPASCSASIPPAMPIIKTPWWRMCAPPSPTATPRGSDSWPPGRWPSCRCRTAAPPSCGASRAPRRRACAPWIPRRSAPL